MSCTKKSDETETPALVSDTHEYDKADPQHPTYCGWVDKIEDRPQKYIKEYMSYAVSLQSPNGYRKIRIDSYSSDDNQYDQVRLAQMTDSLLCFCKMGPNDDPQNSTHKSWVRFMDIFKVASNKVGQKSSNKLFQETFQKQQIQCGEIPKAM